MPQLAETFKTTKPCKQDSNINSPPAEDHSTHHAAEARHTQLSSNTSLTGPPSSPAFSINTLNVLHEDVTLGQNQLFHWGHMDRA
jgi:hypothetical protein